MLASFNICNIYVTRSPCPWLRLESLFAKVGSDGIRLPLPGECQIFSHEHRRLNLGDTGCRIIGECKGKKEKEVMKTHVDKQPWERWALWRM